MIIVRYGSMYSKCWSLCHPSVCCKCKKGSRFVELWEKFDFLLRFSSHLISSLLKIKLKYFYSYVYEKPFRINEIQGPLSFTFNQEAMSEYPASQRISKIKTELPPCALRYHPSIPSLIFIGTYNLNKETKERTGSIEIYSSDQAGLTLLQSIPTQSAILDLKFSPFDDSVIYTGHSTGDLTIWKFDHETEKLDKITNQRVFEEDVLITSVIPSQTLQNTLLLTTTDGYVSVVEINDYKVSEPRSFGTNHDLECWTGCFGNLAELSNVIFTGGDDASLIAHDLREPENLSIFHAKRLHNAGVVSIQTSQPGNHQGLNDWNLDKPYSLWTGSYDDTLRDLDLRCIPNSGLIQGLIPKTKHQLPLGGGVWRLQPSSIKGDNRVLACCMYDGARILNANNDEPVVDRYFKQDHESMVYGCDWSPKGDEVATCSFYDCILQVWSPDKTI